MKLAIKGNPKRSKEVIEILEMLGGVNKYYIINTEENLLYCLREIDNVIIATYPNNSITVFTLEEFIEKFPYKIGDEVIYTAGNGIITKATWDHEDNEMLYDVKVGNTSWLTDAKHLQPYKEESMNKANKSVFDNNAQCCDISNKIIKKETMGKEISGAIVDRFICLEGYDFYDDKGNVIDTKEITMKKKQPKFPKTYEECWYMLKHDINNDKVTGYKNNILSSLQKLLICRDAYWKIAGEQMGLGKPWEPDWTNEKQIVYGLYNELKYSIINPSQFVFPTEEMRDAFYENFKKTIEECKELL